MAINNKMRDSTKAKTLKYRGYEGSVEFSEEDNCFFGKILGITDLVLYESEAHGGLFESFKDAVDDYIKFRQEHEK